MKSNAIIRIILFSLAIFVLLGILLGSLVFDTYRFSATQRSGQIETLEQIDVHNISPHIRNIEIDWVAGSITFQKDSHASDISIQEFSSVESKYKMVLKQAGQTLKVQYCADDSLKLQFGMNVDIQKDLVITVPMDWECTSLEIDSAAAEVTLNDMVIQEFDFDGASGACRMNNCKIGELDMDTASGDVHFFGTLESLDCDAASADCDIEVFNVPRSIKMDGMSGDLTLVLPPDAGFICNMDTMSGSFDSDFTFKAHDGTYVCGDGECKINVNGMSGAVSILKGISNSK